MEALGELFGHDAVGNEFADGIQARIDAVDIQQRLQKRLTEGTGARRRERAVQEAE